VDILRRVRMRAQPFPQGVWRRKSWPHGHARPDGNGPARALRRQGDEGGGFAHGRAEAVRRLLRLGEETSSQDADTDVTALRPWRQLTRGVLRAQAASMLGDLKQCPPMYSAVKVGGTRLYQLARQGKVIERRARDVRVDEFDLFFDVCSDGEDEEKSSGTSPSSSSSPPENDDDMKVACQDVRFRVACSKGTYVRTLANDLGDAVGSAAHLTALRRTHVREFSIENAWNLDQLCQSLVALADAER